MRAEVAGKEQCQASIGRSPRESVAFQKINSSSLLPDGRAAVENISIGVFWVGPDGHILWANTALLDLLGYSQESLSGTEVGSLFSNSAVVLERFSRLLNFEQVDDFEAEVVTCNRSTKQVVISSSAVLERGRFKCATFFVRDISERVRAENSRRFLLQAGRLLASSLDYKQNVQTLVRLAVPQLADWCAIHILGDDGKIELLEVAHANPEKLELARAIRQNYPIDAEQEVGSARVIRTGQAEMIEHIPQELLASMAKSREHLKHILGLGLKSYISVPLKSRDRTFGALTLVFAESGRKYRSSDITVAQELANLASLALENARLYEESQKSLSDKEESLALLNSLVSAAPVGVGFLNKDLHIIKANGVLAEFFLCSNKNLVGRKIDDVICSDRAVVKNLAHVVLNGVEFVTQEISLPNSSGTSNHWVVSVYPVKIESRISGLGIIANDITSRKKIEQQLSRAFDGEKLAREDLENSQRRLNVALEAANMAAWEANLDTGAVTRSKGHDRLFGYNYDLPQWTYEDFIASLHPEDREQVKFSLEHGADSGESHYTGEFRVVWPDSSVHWLHSRARYIRDESGALEKVQGVTLDITSIKETQSQLRRAKEVAEGANLAKSQFLANMSHEIRTPLGAIVGFSDLLQNSDQSRSEKRSSIAAIRRNARLLTHIVDDILDLSKVESGRMEVEFSTFSIKDLIFELLHMMSLKAAEKGILFEAVNATGVPEVVSSDSIKIRQVLINVIGNAIKFTEKGKVTLTVKYDPSTTSPALNFMVQDTGCGIPQDKQTRIFEPFMQADVSTRRRFGGTGLGLALSRKLALLMNGQLSLVKSLPKQGSLFEFKVPIQVLSDDVFRGEFTLQTAMSEQQVDGSDDSLIGVRVLCVDDVQDNQFLIGRFLKKAGAVVEFASDGREGVDKALTGDFDLILMDIQMPEMDGYEAVVTLRKNNYTGPIIALTAHAMKEEKERCCQLGFNDHLAKPIRRHDLISKIKEFVPSDSDSSSAECETTI